LVSQQELPQTEAMLGKALSAAPGKRELRLRLAEVMMANNEPLPARAILAPLKNISDDDAIQRRAQSMLDAIQVRLENERALRDYNERRAAAEAEAKARTGAAVDSSRDNARNQQVDAPPSIRRSDATTTSKDETVETAKLTLKRPAGLQVEGALILIDCR